MAQIIPARFLLFLVPPLLLACGGDDGGPDGNEPITLRGTCDEAVRVGGFQVAIGPDFSAVDGQVYNAVLPVAVRDEVSVEGDCRLMRRVNPFCDPACGSSEVCNRDGTCSPQRVAQDVGVITLTGLEEDITMEPRAPGNNYFATPATNPIFTADAEVRLFSTDGAYGELSMGGFGFAPLAIGAGDWVLSAGQSLDLTWTPSASADEARVGFELTINQHGTSPVALECDFPDTGSASVGATVLDALRAEGVSGFPSGSVTRRTVDKVTVADGCVDFTIASPVTNSVVVDGHTPCDSPDDCPSGQTCDIPNETCIDIP